MSQGKPRTHWRDALVEICIGSAVAAVVSLLLVALLRSSIKASDALAFFGAAVGAGLAVLGAVWIERWKRVQADRRQEAVLNQLILEFRELVCQARFNEEPVSSPATDLGDRYNRRARFIEETSALAEALERELVKLDTSSGSVLRTAVRLKREIQRQDYLRNPDEFRIDNKLSTLAFLQRYYSNAKFRGPMLLEALDNFIGALHSFGVSGLDVGALNRVPNPRITDL